MLVSQHHRYNSSYTARPTASNFLTQFTAWAKVWISSSTSLAALSPSRKRKLILMDTAHFRDTDIRSRVNYYDQAHSIHNTVPTISQRASLYRSTCQKLRPNHSKLTRLGDMIHVRHFWDDLEKLAFPDLTSNTNHHYVAPSKRVPFNPDKLGSLYRPKRSKKLPPMYFQQKRKRPSFGSSTIVYTQTPNQHVQILPIHITCRIPPHRRVPQAMRGLVHQHDEQEDDDDDDVPLGALQLS
ncbi:uncharacterized protein ATC70_011254 [Mucor velutinosus]|uniref:Uncharacterized protein n=1 Tax=Mucor velutinosus TaxID=708070 RepID=A0AAN7DGM8_9FUNG|nr:hypothetical protein ATC70_011254 [Mucor velutinosus]